MRVRETEEKTSYPAAYLRYAGRNGGSIGPPVWMNPSPPNNSEFLSAAGEAITRLQRCEDLVTPGFFRARRKGEIIRVNPFLKKTEEYPKGTKVDCRISWSVEKEVSPGQWVFKHQTTWIQGGIPRHMRNPPIPPAHSFDKQSMLQEALAKGRQELWDFGTFMAEFGKTATLVSQAASRTHERVNTIADILARDVRSNKARVRSMKDLVDQFASMWMEGRYGWRLLAMDLRDAQLAYQRLSEGYLEWRKRYTVIQDESDQDESPWADIAPGYGGISPFQFRWQWDHSTIGRAGVGVSMEANTPVTVDPLVTLYEVTPLSIIASWLSNVEHAVKAWSPFGEGKLDYGFFTTRELITNQLIVRVNPDFNYSYGMESQLAGVTPTIRELTLNVDTANGVFIRELKRREPMSPSFNLRVQNNISGLTVVDAAALTWLLRRKLGAIFRAIRT